MEASPESVSASRAGEADNAGVPLPPPLIFVGGLVVGIALELVFPTGSLPLVLAIVAGLAGLVALLFLDGTAMMRFRRAGTSMIPFQPTTAIVTTGPYRFTRNPMYVGMAVLYVGLALAFGLLWALAVFPLVVLAVDRLVIAREERYLARKFGEEYLAYKRRVRRWL